MLLEPVAVVVLLVWLLCLAINVAGIVVGLRLWRARPAGSSRARSLLLVGAIVAVAFAIAAAIVAVVRPLGAVGGESIDPSEKARILAEGISEAMNLMALALLVGLPISIAVLVYGAVTRRRAKRGLKP